MEVIAVDLGGTHLRVARVVNGKIFDYIKKETPKTKKDILNEIVLMISSLINKKVRGIGIACAGIIEKGFVKISPNLPIKGVNFKKYFEKKFKVKVEIENDANCVALSESRFGVKKKNFFILTLGTGVGGGIIINGELYKGRGGGGEFGHIILDREKDFEYFVGSASIKNLIEVIYKIKKIDDNFIIKVLSNNVRKSNKIKKEISNYVGQGIASLISIFDPEVIVLTGGVTELWNDFLEEIRNNVKKYSFIKDIPEIKFSNLKHPGILGASLLIK